MGTTTGLVSGAGKLVALDALPEHEPPLGEERVDAYALDGASLLQGMGPSSAQVLGVRAAQVQEIARLGYPVRVAAQLVESYPQIAAEIVALAKRDAVIPRVGPDRWSYYFHGERAWEPVTLYRGIDAEVVQGDRKLESEKLPTKYSFNYCSPVLGYPIMRALWSAGVNDEGRTRGIITEIVVPKYLVFGDYHPSLYEGRGNVYIGGVHPVLLIDMVPDLKPFTNRVGVVEFTRDAANRKDSGDEGLIAWQPDGAIDPYVTSASVGPVEVLIRKPARWLDTLQPRDYAAHVGVEGVQLGFV